MSGRTRRSAASGVSRSRLAPLGAAAGALLGSAGAAALCRLAPNAMTAPWSRTNHAGRPVTLLEGPVWVTGAVLGTVVAGAAIGGRSTGPARVAALATVAAGGLGMLDDLAGSSSSKGLRGHLGALARGRVTTGAVKFVGLGVTGVVAAGAIDRGRRGPFVSLLGGAAIAGSANLVNLLDLRPGRALKAVVALAAPMAATSPAAAAAAGASLGVIRDDLGARSMLGDTGANAAGALLGCALVERTGLPGRAIALAVLVGLTLASERVSFSAVIERTPVLRRVDEWGRASAEPSR